MSYMQRWYQKYAYVGRYSSLEDDETLKVSEDSVNNYELADPLADVLFFLDGTYTCHTT